MNKFLFTMLMCCFTSLNVSAQMEFPATSPAAPVLGLDAMMRYADFHIHPTYKHYFRPKSADTMKLIRAITTYDRIRDTIIYSNPGLVESIRKINWIKYQNEKTFKSKKDPLTNGLTSNLRNYDQAGYPELSFVPGSILCNSYSPYEKQFVLEESQRKISSKVVTKMGIERLRAYADDNHTPLSDFLSEYFYNTILQEEMFIESSAPDQLYSSYGNTFHQNIPYYLAFKMVKNSDELKEIVKHNDEIFQNWTSTDPPPHFITPLLMAIEGGQVLYDKLSSKKSIILNPLNLTITGKKFSPYFTGVSSDSLKLVHDELLKSVDSIRNLHHRLFFMTLGHFAENHVVGYAKTLDRDPESLEHRALSTASIFSKVRDKLAKKGYAGFNPGINMSAASKCKPDSIGFKIVKAFLDPDSTKTRFKKPTYIDVKHMDIQARIQYYYERRNYEKLFDIKIPIVASHFGVSGENQAMAAATGLWPNSDRYREIEHPKSYYKIAILRKFPFGRREHFWTSSVMGAPDSTSKNDSAYYYDEVLDPFDRAMYRSLNFSDPTILTSNKAYDPFENFKLDKKNKVGWFYPWSINLFDEEIIEINKSDGIIGLLLDPRQLGAFMPKYKHKQHKNKEQFEKIIKSIRPEDLAKYQLDSTDINWIDYYKSEPLLRNLFYIVQIILQRQKEEDFFKRVCGEDMQVMQKSYPNYIHDEVSTAKPAWELVSIGSDYDGLIDPIDFAPTVSYIPLLRRRMVFFAWIFAQMHHDIFKDPFNNEKPFIIDLDDSNKKMHQFFYANGRNFILKYF